MIACINLQLAVIASDFLRGWGWGVLCVLYCFNQERGGGGGPLGTLGHFSCGEVG